MNDQTPALSNDASQKAAMAVLTEHAREIFAGSYANVDQIFQLTDQEKNPPEIAELAEAIGLMSVKVEAREFDLEQTIEELRHHQAELEKSNQIRLQLTSIFINIVLLITVYTFALGFLNSNLAIVSELAPQIKKWASRIIEIFALVLVIRMIVRSKLPLQSFGISVDNWRRSVAESLLATAAVIGLLVAIKFSVNAYMPGQFGETQIFDIAYLDATYVTYIVVAPRACPEFCVNGV